MHLERTRKTPSTLGLPSHIASAPCPADVLVCQPFLVSSLLLNLSNSVACLGIFFVCSLSLSPFASLWSPAFPHSSPLQLLLQLRLRPPEPHMLKKRRTSLKRIFLSRFISKRRRLLAFPLSSALILLHETLNTILYSAPM